VSNLVLLAKEKNADKEYFRIEVFYEYLILKNCQLKIKLGNFKMKSSAVCILQQVSLVTKFERGGGGEVLCHRKDNFT
jgi:hypothetical protein